jgi:hypothetical protein
MNSSFLPRQACIGLDALHLAALGLIQNAERDLYLMTPDLEPQRLNRADLALAISVFARSSPRTRVRILITSTDRLSNNAHALISLYRRMPSRIEIRQVRPDDAKEERQMIIDGRHRLLIDQSDRQWSGWFCPHEVPQAAQQTEYFEYLWDHAQPIRELRQLSI